MITTKIVGKFTWLDVLAPTEKDFKRIQEKYNFRLLDIDDCRSHLQRPKLEVYQDYRFAVIQVPMKSARRMKLIEVDVFWSEKFIVTVHKDELPIIKDMMSKLNKKTQKNISGRRLFFEITNNLIMQIFPLLLRYRKSIDRIDNNMFNPDSKEIVEDINEVRRDIILAQTNVKQLLPIYAHLDMLAKKENSQFAEYWGEIIDNLSKIKDEFEDFQEIIEGLNSSLESILNHRTNEIIKTLTIFNVIMMPLTFITGFYGMNIEQLPFARTHEALIVIVTVMITIGVSMFIYFKIKKWI